MYKSLDSLAGNLQKAIICVPKHSAVKNYNNPVGQTAKGRLAIQKGMMALAKAKLNNEPLPEGGADMAKMDLIGSQGYVMLKVQYNPSTLAIRSQGGKTVKYTSGLGQGSENQLSQINQMTKTVLGCELIFTDVNPLDAFMLENMAPNLSNAVTLTKDLVHRDFSVQDQVEGLMACLTQTYSRQVIFVWGNTIFPGELVSVDANYSMFNKKGAPIAATVNLQIEQNDSDELFDNSYWQSAFEAVFKEE